MFYDNFNEVCRQKGTTITGVLKALGKSTGCAAPFAAPESASL